ncbi:MAG TPA: hypothetical protein VFJ61_12220 [Solirubrobacterales bacterium]|nr:hypothetical protein [Solirubrobacterales bacterium]
MTGPDLLQNWSKPSPSVSTEGGTVFVNPLHAGRTVLVARVGDAEGSLGAAAALACAGARLDQASLLVTVGGRQPRPALLASAAAQKLEERLGSHLPELKPAARGQVCQLAVPAEEGGLAAAAAAATVAREAAVVVHLPPELVQKSLEGDAPLAPAAMLLRADLPLDRPLAALAASDLIRRGLAVAVLKRRLGWVVERRALFGALPAGAPGGLPERVVRRLLPEPR